MIDRGLEEADVLGRSRLGAGGGSQDEPGKKTETRGLVGSTEAAAGTRPATLTRKWGLRRLVTCVL